MPGPLRQDQPSAGSERVRDREAYFVAAYQLLAGGGCEAVTIAALGERLNATKGSFYHHFADMADFVAAFGERWRQWMVQMTAGFAAEPDPLRRLELAGNETMAQYTAADSAIRAWARTNPALACVLGEVNDLVDEVLGAAYTELAGDPDLGLLLARTVRCIWVGFSLRVDEPGPEWLLRVGHEFARRSLGLEVAPVAMAGGGQWIGFVDEPRPGFRLDPAWVPPRVHGLEWVDDEPNREPAGPSGRPARGKDDFFDAARELLAKGGAPAITIAALCERLGVTKGAFYWRFESMDEFVQALATHWEQTQDARLAAVVDDPDPAARLALILQDMLRRPDPADTAFRAWAHTDPTVGPALHRIDRHRQNVYTATIRDATADPAADVLAELTLELAIGLHDRQPAMDPDLATRIVMLWAHRFLHRTPAFDVANGRPALLLTHPPEII